jgi:peptidoglycan/xylan/chitin deacetylase (PgdA/CDA1 family)
MRARRRWLVGVAAIVLVLIAAGCSPSQPSSQPPAAQPTSTRPARSASRPTTPVAKPTPRKTAQPTWVGRFAGAKVQIPYGHGAHVSFTFDDGPSAEFTPQVLALLRQHHVHAVFCLIGTQARSYPALVRKEVRAGHRLCDHSRDHDLNMNGKGKRYIAAEVNDGLADIHGAAPGAPVAFYRQPGGLWSPKVVRAMTRAKLYPMRWSDDPRDWSRPGSATIVKRVVKHLHPGAVILMHDGGGDRSQTIKALAWLLKAVAAAGWHPVLAPKVHLSVAAAARPQ